MLHSPSHRDARGGASGDMDLMFAHSVKMTNVMKTWNKERLC